ncbi:MAG: hypothetical protein VX193_03635, partial [Candidatus Thermoplasmatota archaeon]|nr:hypothetical protein [Candidatus Thermoplasmatota archaeon]
MGLKGYIKLVHLLPTGVSSAQLASQLNGFYSSHSYLLTAARQAQGSSNSGQSGFEQAQRNFLIRLQDSNSSSYHESQIDSLVREAIANQQLLSLGLAADVSLQRLAWELWRSQYPALSSGSSGGSYYPDSGQTSLATALDTALNQGSGDLAQLAVVLKASPYSAVYRGQSLDLAALQQAVAAVQILLPDYYSYYPAGGQASPDNIYLAQELAQIVGVGASSISSSLDTALQQTAATAGYAAMTVEQRWSTLQTALTAADNSLTAADSNLTAQVLEQALQQGRAQRYDQAISSSMSSGGSSNFSPAGYISNQSWSSYNSGGDELLLRPALLAVELGLSQTELEEAILNAYQTDSNGYRTPINPSGLGSLLSAL